MKKTFLIGTLLVAAAPAFAERVLVAPAGSLCAGASVESGQFTHFLYEGRACSLPIVHAKDMRAFRMKSPVSMELNGCWGKTLGDKILFVDSDGTTSSMPAGVFAEVELDKQGRGKVLSSFSQDKGWISCP
ncbi:hypothetical protein [Pseudomonas nitroreducens]|uniref:Uncharacterized protein n=1 Tax=Pseudomonas nitroreducens TaxID=46680 RepID=A0A6G6IY16_PSENT|nr:hypothetical protein [Pseudomonas nitroreducens]QIE88035.1 hypothetical protein G5B91_17860 [Pseudomonas nitroreducens]